MSFLSRVFGALYIHFCFTQMTKLVKCKVLCNTSICTAETYYRLEHLNMIYCVTEGNNGSFARILMLCLVMVYVPCLSQYLCLLFYHSDYFLLGNSQDLRLVRQYLELSLPNERFEFLMSAINEVCLPN